MKPTMLMILDGYGINKDTEAMPSAQAHKPNLDEIFASYPIQHLKPAVLTWTSRRSDGKLGGWSSEYRGGAALSIRTLPR